ncbi:hypothetical protein J4439_07635 [Candidatus Woesearchaeota archaeon]|nr:hypothetical protein [Candidatus Woesearchaeota archaeon]
MGRAPSHKKTYAPKPKWAQEQDQFMKGKRYPLCRGTFPDCPEEIKPDVVALVCTMCPIYMKG